MAFNGKYQLESQENFEEFMKAIGKFVLVAADWRME